MKSYNLHQLNDDTPTRLGMVGQRDTRPDLIFVSPQLIPAIEWTIMGDHMGSDHLPIQILIQETLPNTTRSYKTRMDIGETWLNPQY